VEVHEVIALDIVSAKSRAVRAFGKP